MLPLPFYLPVPSQTEDWRKDFHPEKQETTNANYFREDWGKMNEDMIQENYFRGDWGKNAK